MIMCESFKHGPVLDFPKLGVQWSFERIHENVVMVGGKHLLAIPSRLLVGYVAPANAQVDTGHEFLAVGSHS